MPEGYYKPSWWNYTAAFGALYDPGSEVSTEYGINAWIDGGLSANKLVLGLPFYGYAWTLANPNDSAIGAPAKGSAITDDGDSNFSTFFSMATQPSHRSSFIESSIQRARLYGFHGLELCCVKPDTSTTKMETMGILFDDWRTAVDRESKNSTRSLLLLTLASDYLLSKNSTSYPMESIQRNFDWVHIVSYYYHLPTMENFTGAHSVLYDPSSNECSISLVYCYMVSSHSSVMYKFIAQEDEKDPRNKRQLLLVILLPTAATVTLVLVSTTWYLRKRARRNKDKFVPAVKILFLNHFPSPS
ncbi:hypothetical protein RHSIM_Rhsim01G0188600 [Rhododendron simsii]|uniref:GH18 domain-containing protein n=1 Tax=Rhododendron simsii TaxID=118357 RepID=A0A834M063_RHOSS|nr:hypothetical protein RHSIM_Rhsim01G0188600 [Rhododendron simsii]